MNLIKLSLGLETTPLRDAHLASHYYPESKLGKCKKCEFPDRSGTRRRGLSRAALYDTQEAGIAFLK
jgi:hypothetical protein